MLPDILLTADDNNPKSNWKLGKIINVIKKEDGVTQGYKIQYNKGYSIERLLQSIKDLEIKTANKEIN